MTTKPYPEEALVWVDTEFSHLNPYEDPEAVFLQVAVLVTDLQLNLLDEDGYEALIAWDPERIAKAKATAVPIVQDMHDTNGLWQRCTGTQSGARSIETVSAEVYQYVTALVPEQRTSRLAGNSVAADKLYLERFMPDVWNHLHYRLADVSSLTGFSQWWAGTDVMPKAKNHTAMEDIRESIAEARWLKARTFDRIPRDGRMG